MIRRLAHKEQWAGKGGFSRVFRADVLVYPGTGTRVVRHGLPADFASGNSVISTIFLQMDLSAGVNPFHTEALAASADLGEGTPPGVRRLYGTID